MSRGPDPVATRIRGRDAGHDPAPSRHRGAGVRAWAGPLLALLALGALAIAGYLTWTRLSGGTLSCAILTGCQTVETSPYSAFLGIPVGAFGMVGSGVTLAGALLWWRRADRRGLMVAYLVGLASLPVLGWLTYLELAVIHAVCIWCVTYAVLVIAGWIVAMIGLRGREREDGS